MVTDGMVQATKQILWETFYAGKSDDTSENDIIEQRLNEMIILIRAEAINLADKLIGKDVLLHSNHKNNNGELNPVEKAIFDFQVRQRIALAVYQSPPEGNIYGSEDLINAELSENEE